MFRRLGTALALIAALTLPAHAGSWMMNSYVSFPSGGACCTTAPSFRAVGTFDSGLSSAVPGVPAGTTTNDIMVLACESDSADTYPTPSGWTLKGTAVSSGTGSSDTKITVFWKRAGASESAPTVGDAGDHNACIILSFSGAATAGDPFDSFTNGTNHISNTTSFSATGVTSGSSNVMMIVIGTAGTAASSMSGEANASWVSVTERSDNNTGSGNGGHLVTMQGVLTAAGASGTTTGTWSGSTHDAAFTLALMGT